MKNFKIFLTIVVLIGAIACTDKFDAPDNSVNPNNQVVGDTVYIQQFPVWEGFNNPHDMIVGREPFLYIADTDNDRILMMDVSGKIYGSKTVRRPIAIAQDFNLNLIVCAQFDTTINNVSQAYSAVYKLDLFSVSHNISQAPLKRLLPRTSFDFSRPLREYTGVCVFGGNDFYIARKGPVNSSPIDPDNSILIFKNITKSDGIKKDTLVGRVPLIAPQGTGIVSANQISSLTSFNNGTLDIVVTLIGENSFKVQWLEYVQTTIFTGYESKLSPFSCEMMDVGKFGKPEGTALDNYKNFYIADAEKDSVFKFNNFGDELQSFGGSNVMKNPHAVAFHDRTLYVLDTGNNRILRFILSTDID